VIKHKAISGWASLTVMGVFLCGIKPTFSGDDREYMGPLMMEVKSRPLAVVKCVRPKNREESRAGQILSEVKPVWFDKHGEEA